MLTPRDSWGGLLKAGRSFVALSVLLAGATSYTTIVLAQSAPASASNPNGAVWIDRGSVREPRREVEPARPPAQDPVRDAEDGAQHMLRDALADLALGRRQPAQRLMELLIARYPDSAAAADARRRLAKLYAGDGTSALPSASVTAASHREPATTQAGAEAHPAGTGWRIDVRRNTAAEEDFRAKAGDRIFFSAGSADLGSRARAVLEAQAKWLNRYTALDVVVEGHSDEPGGEEANRVIARARAEAVRDRLIAEGVAQDRVGILVRGNAERISICPETACAAQNRRAVTSLIETERASTRRVAGERNDTPPARNAIGGGPPR